MFPPFSFFFCQGELERSLTQGLPFLPLPPFLVLTAFFFFFSENVPASGFVLSVPRKEYPASVAVDHWSPFFAFFNLLPSFSFPLPLFFFFFSIPFPPSLLPSFPPSPSLLPSFPLSLLPPSLSSLSPSFPSTFLLLRQLRDLLVQKDEKTLFYAGKKSIMRLNTKTGKVIFYDFLCFIL